MNKKGYMLVEIIVAFAIAVAIMYLITDITIRVKNKNDDLMVRILTATDQAIIYNMVMSDVNDGNSFSCYNSGADTYIISGKTITYNNKKIILNDYVDKLSCSGNTIQIGVKVLNENFDVVIPSYSSGGDNLGGEYVSYCDMNKVTHVDFYIYTPILAYPLGTSLDFLSKYIYAEVNYSYSDEYVDWAKENGKDLDRCNFGGTSFDSLMASNHGKISGGINEIGDNTITVTYYDYTTTTADGSFRQYSEDFKIVGAANYEHSPTYIYIYGSDN